MRKTQDEQHERKSERRKHPKMLYRSLMNLFGKILIDRSSN